MAAIPIVSLGLLRAQSDERLLEVSAEGHDRAFEVIFERYRRPLERHCRRIVPDGRAEDIVQQTFLAAWLALRDGCEVRDLRAWLHRIAHNAALAAARRPGYDHEELPDSLHGASADHEIEVRSTMRETLAALAALPDRQRDALLRTATHDASPAEAAVEFGLSENAFRQLVFRARSAMRAGVAAVTPLPLVSWAASAGSAGVGAVAATSITGTALVKVGVAAVAAGTVGVSVATVVPPDARAPSVAATAAGQTHAGNGAWAAPTPTGGGWPSVAWRRGQEGDPGRTGGDISSEESAPPSGYESETDGGSEQLTEPPQTPAAAVPANEAVHIQQSAPAAPAPLEPMARGSTADAPPGPEVASTTRATPVADPRETNPQAQESDIQGEAPWSTEPGSTALDDAGSQTTGAGDAQSDDAAEDPDER